MTLTTKNKVGLALAGLLGVLDLPSFLEAPSDGEVGPPLGILILGSICGLITIVAVVIAWRSASGAAIRVVAGARIVSMLTALPAFFMDVEAFIKVLVTVFTILTLTSLVLMFSPARRSAAVMD
ncbi:hypothetical protein [Aeromicrobium ginsengisoli]|uniref:Uncharacterized protein n=1 Tax=Aeromicrobium ginsengisoli TaxID=363867 RepID=A0A5M4FEK7_9ACTN|nr:hypothetical protein [Aeromicrobium ginsengisoli]KAA1397271.1 hypothetical protein ESP70_007705 [Aeromicrobium ginsengisoli]